MSVPAASPTSSTLLAGLTVIEQPHSVALRYCGRLLAALGARVLQAGAPWATGVGFGGAASSAYAAWLDAGKERLAGLDQALTQAGKLDLLIAGPGAVQLQAADAALQSAAASSHGALRLGLTWFAPDGPYRDWVGSDAVIQAMSGVAYATGPVDGLPMLPRGHAPQVVAGLTAAIAALGALLGRRRGWAGQRIEVDVLSANLCFYESSTCSMAPTGDRVARRGVNRFTPTYPGGIYRTRDGWIGITALTPPQWAAFCDMIGQPLLGREPRYQVSLQRLAEADVLDPLLRPAIAQRCSADWLAEGQARRIPFAPVPDLAELPLTPHWRERGSFAPVPGAGTAVGPTLPFGVEAVPVSAPARAEASHAVAVTDRRPAAPSAPLAGLRVLDLAMGWAGPLATRCLADLGADVIKVESCSHVDWWRGFDAPDLSDPPPYETRPGFLMINRHKRGITLDLKTHDGVALLRRLAARSDLMVENYAPGVLDKLGVGTRQLAGAVPGLVALSMGAFGNRGPWREFRAYGSTVEQASGFPFVNGQSEDPPTMQHVAYGDPVAGLYGAVACLAALHGRESQSDTGRATSASLIDLGQVECLFQLGADAIVAQSTQDEPLVRQGSRHPLSALRMIAACAAAAGAATDVPAWIALSAETVAQWRSLAELVGHDAGGDAAGGITALKSQEDRLEAAVQAWAAAQEADAAVALLQQAGIPAGPVRAGSALMDDAQLAALGCFRWLERPFAGRHLTTQSAFRIDGQPLPIGAPAPTLGQANAEVLGGLLGLGEAELADLARAGVIGHRAVWPT